MKRFLVFVILLYSSFYLVSTDQVKPHPKPTVYSVIEGHDLRINCIARETPDVEIFWVKNDTKSQFRENGTYLTFINIHRDTAGEYICYSLNVTTDNFSTTGSPTLVETVKVDVLYPAEITGFFVDKTVVMQNRQFQVHCNFSGNPMPDFVVMNNDTKRVDIIAHGSVNVINTIPKARCEDAGLWMCTGRNYLNNPERNATRAANVTVLCAPHPKEGNRYKVHATLGASAFLIMNNYGYPKPNYTWSHNGRVLPREQHKDFGWVSFLNISNVQVEDFGLYNLNIVNAYGSYNPSFELTADGLPQRPSMVRYSDLTHNSVKLSWTSGFDMGSRQHFYVIGRYHGKQYSFSDKIYDNSGNHGINDHFEYMVTSLLPDTYYQFEITAWNAHGIPVSSNNTVEFRSKAVPPTEPPTVTYTSLGVILGSTFGALAFVGLLAFLVYMVKYRTMNTSYDTMNERTKINKSTSIERAGQMDERKSPIP